MCLDALEFKVRLSVSLSESWNSKSGLYFLQASAAATSLAAATFLSTATFLTAATSWRLSAVFSRAAATARLAAASHEAVRFSRGPSGSLAVRPVLSRREACRCQSR